MSLATRVRRPFPPARALAGVLAVAVLLGACTAAQPRTEGAQQAGDARLADARLSDAEFWEIFTTMSEPGGSFPSENFVSNEMTYQHVIPELQRSLTRGGVYLGVGPEQNFTYIANLRPRLAVIFDIRRQNAMQHLMYKALFEMSPTRAQFVARLFSRPAVARLRTVPGLSARALFDSVEAAAPSDSARAANADAVVATLTGRHGFALSPGDLATIDHVYRVFHEAGPSVDYAYRLGRGVFARSTYPTYAMVQSATNADSLPMAFLASEQHYRAVRELQLRNLIVPVVGDFAGPRAIRAVGEYLQKRRMTVTAFYLSNVEQYLFRSPGASERFYTNVATLPIDSTSTFIRSVPPNGVGPRMSILTSGGMVNGMATGPVSGTMSMGSFTMSFTVRDSAGTRLLRAVVDSAGVPVVRTMRDSAGTWVSPRDPRDTTRAVAPPDTALLTMIRRFGLNVGPSVVFPARPGGAAPAFRTTVMASLLDSGLAPMRGTLDAFVAGRLGTYQDAIAMTRTTGWK